jgi:hypothetical protein
MTERPEVRFNFYNKTADIMGAQNLEYDTVAFNVGGGVYDFTNYTYTIPADGVYLIGYSYIKGAGSAYTDFNFKRGTITRTLNRAQLTGTGGSNYSMCGTFLFNFLEGDIISVYSIFNFTTVTMNRFAYDTTDIYNSFWGIRLNYDVSIS